MNRRDFIGAAAAAGILGVPQGLLAGKWDLSPRSPDRPLPQPAARAAGDYSAIVIGDTHYDRAPEAVYHAAYPGTGVDARLCAIQRAEFARNGEMWASRIPRLLAAAKKARRPDTAFAVQVGDLIQGDCNDGKVHARMATDAFGEIKCSLGGDLPLHVVVGNHDVRNGCRDDAAGFFRSWLAERMTAELAQPVKSSNFAKVHGPDLWIYVDFTAPNLKFIERTLAANSPVRYTFLVTHGPAIPSDNDWYGWILFGYGRHEERRALRKLLLRHDVIVVAGHIHTTELTECVTDDGRITQIIANSVWKEERLATVAPQYTTPGQYGSGQKSQAGRDYLGEYRPALTRHFRSAAAGFFRLDVSASGVQAHFFGGDAATPAFTWKIR